MPEATATIGAPSFSSHPAQSLTASMNGPAVLTGDMNLANEVKAWVRIFNVGPLDHRVDRPWRSGGVRIPACPIGAEYSQPVSIPLVIQEKVSIEGSNEILFRGRDGKFYAQDVLNPDDPSGNWRTVDRVDYSKSTNAGTNLYRWGCFWTENEVPSPEELRAAKIQLEKHLNFLIQQAGELFIAAQDPKYAGERVGLAHHTAADYFGIQTEWHRKHVSNFPCPGCGTLLPDGVVICSKCPATFDWQRALDLGLRTKKQAIEAGVMEPTR